MFDLVSDSLDHMESNLKSENPEQYIDKANELETAINKYRNHLRKEYLNDVSKGSYNIQSGIIYNDIFSSLEKIGDHVINVSEALVMKEHSS